MEPARGSTKEKGGGPASVRNFLSGSGAGGITFWCGDLNVAGGDVQEAGGSARGLPQTGDGAEVQAAEGRDLEKCGSGKGNQGSGNPDTEGVH